MFGNRETVNMKTPSKKYLRRKADKLFIEAVLRLKGDRCELCGQQASTVHHYIPKSRSEATRYYIPNGVPICKGCHKKIHAWDPHLSGKIVALRGLGWRDELEIRSRDIVSGRVTIKYLKENIEKLEEILKQ